MNRAGNTNTIDGELDQNPIPTRGPGESPRNLDPVFCSTPTNEGIEGTPPTESNADQASNCKAMPLEQPQGNHEASNKVVKDHCQAETMQQERTKDSVKPQVEENDDENQSVEKVVNTGTTYSRWKKVGR